MRNNHKQFYLLIVKSFKKLFVLEPTWLKMKWVYSCLAHLRSSPKSFVLYFGAKNIQEHTFSGDVEVV